jgi:hypothetical protein
MAHVPNHTVARGIKQVVESNGKLDDAETGPEVPPRGSDGVDGLGPQFRRHLGEIALIQTAKVRGGLYRV